MRVTTTPKFEVILARAGFRTVSDLARIAGYKPQTLHAVRCGALRMSLRMAARLADHLNVSAAQVPALFRGER